MITQQQIDQISDDFQSTFVLSQTNPDVLCNMFYEWEQPQIEQLIRKYVPDVTKVEFVAGQAVGPPGYGIRAAVIHRKEAQDGAAETR